MSRGSVSIPDLVVEAASNLKGQGRRSALALLGVVIGAGSIVALMNIAYMAQVTTLKTFRQTGVDVISIKAEDAGQGTLRVERIENVALRDPSTILVAPHATTNSTIIAGARSQAAVIAAVTPSMARLAGLSPAQGRLARGIDACNHIVVIGRKLATQLSAPGSVIMPGSVVHIGPYGFTVVGILEQVPYQSLSPVTYDEAALIPFECARRVMPHDGATGALVKLAHDADVHAAVTRFKNALSTPHAPVKVEDAKTMIEAMKKQMALVGGVLIAVSSISLLVGGVGVMNVMLMAVMERRREIGLRAAIGATPFDIRMMFLIEAVILALGGGLIGSVLGIVATRVAAIFLPFDFVVSWTVLLLGACVAGAVGLVFGLYPAISASRISPIEALRGE